MPIDIIPANWSAPETVKAFSTTRIGGVSQDPYDSLNLGLHVGDAESHVLENRQRLQRELNLPSAPIWLRQIHGIVVANLDEDAASGAVIEADGAWTSTPGMVVAVLTADCLPVVMTNLDGTKVAAVHAGWRGLVGGVLQSAVSRFDQDETLLAWLGPAIGPTAFEVGGDVREAFLSRDDRFADAFVQTKGSNKWLADLYHLATLALGAAGNVRVSGGQHCTVSEPVRFHSHRRDGVRSGRLATVAWIDHHGV